MKKLCIICEEEFETPLPFQICCNHKCMYKRALQRNKKWREKPGNNHGKKYYLKHRKEQLEKYHNNREAIIKQRKEYRKKNKELFKKREAEYYQYRKKTDVNYKLRKIFRDRINSALGTKNKQSSSNDLIGCSVEKLKKHIEKQFKDGMCWKNHGMYGWHIDHIIPISSFDLTDIVEQKKAFHYTNMQPLWAFDNLSKNKYVKVRDKLIEV